jgi:hypothetical protein
MKRLGAAGCALLLGVACAGDDWIIGSELRREGDAGQGPLAPPDLVDNADVCPSAEELLGERERAHGTPNVLDQHVGRWLGTLGGPAAASFPGLAVELVLDDSGVGTWRFEVEAAAMEPLDPGAGYLCRSEASGVVCGTASGFVGGFGYPLAGARSRDGVLSFVLGGAEPWGGWCALSPPIEWPDASQACGFSFGVRPPARPVWSPAGCARIGADDAEDIDCALMYALERCECGRDACFAALEPRIEVGLVLSEDQRVLAGSLWYENEVDAASLALWRQE